MKAISFRGSIDEDSIKGLLADIDKIDKEESIVLYFTSGGGSVPEMEALVNYINRNPKRFDICCFWEMSSAAFDLLLKSRCKITLGKDCYARIHLYSNDLQYSNLGDPDSLDVFILKELTASNKVWIDQLAVAGFSPEELASIKKGNYVVINSRRMAHVLRAIGGRK